MEITEKRPLQNGWKSHVFTGKGWAVVWQDYSIRFAWKFAGSVTGDSKTARISSENISVIGCPYRLF